MKTNHCLVPLCNICGEMIRSASKFKDVLRSPDPQMLMIRREYSENDIIPDKDGNTLLGKVESELTSPSTELKVLKYKNKKKLKKKKPSENTTTKILYACFVDFKKAFDSG